MLSNVDEVLGEQTSLNVKKEKCGAEAKLILQRACDMVPSISVSADLSRNALLALRHGGSKRSVWRPCGSRVSITK